MGLVAGGQQGARRDHLLGRARDRRDLRGALLLLRWLPRDHRDLGHRAGAQDGGDGARGRDGAAARDRQRAARRPLDRPADQDGTGGHPAGELRAQRRGADPGARGLDARGRVRLRGGGLSQRGAVHDTRDPAHRWLHREWSGSVALARDRGGAALFARISGKSCPRFAACRSRATSVSHVRGRGLARPVSSTASAASSARISLGA